MQNNKFRYGDNRPDNELALIRRYHELALLEPELTTLLRDIGLAQPSSWDWYRSGWKARLSALVGWGSSSDDPELRTTQAYDTVYRYLYSFCYDGPQQ
jgi:hypothetical protein